MSGAVMARFDQRYQRVGHQVNADTVFMSDINQSPGIDTVEAIEKIIGRANEHCQNRQIVDAIIRNLRAAQDASRHNDRQGVRRFLETTALLTKPIAALASAGASIVDLLANLR
jgi:hypothetical protein